MDTALNTASREATAAIFFRAEGFDLHGPALMGKQSANHGFLEALAQHGRGNKLIAYARSHEDFQKFAAVLEGVGRNPRSAIWIPLECSDRLSEPGCLFVPQPILGPHAWGRTRHGNCAYSLCGLTHSCATQRVQDALLQYLVAPLGPWDALVCTSRSAVRAVERTLDLWRERLGARLGQIRMPDVQMPIIPLGVNALSLTPANAPTLRSAFREKLHIADDDIAILYVGRLDYLTKASPIALFKSLQRTASRLGAKKMHLMLVGWYRSSMMRTHFLKGAKQLCPDVVLHELDGRNETLLHESWFGADIFASFPDNIQESFGLTCIEAMAAGLPVVVSDWNGYRDTVRHGIDGFLVPTCMPTDDAAGCIEAGYALGAEPYERFVGGVASTVSVDDIVASEAFEALAKDASLRRSMGTAGQKRIAEHYDWPHVIRAFEALWDELGQRRKWENERTRGTDIVRGQNTIGNPFSIFADHASATLSAETQLYCREEIPLSELMGETKLDLFAFVRESFGSEEEIQRLWELIRTRPGVKPEQLIDASDKNARSRVMRTIGWLMKLGFVYYKPQASR